MKLFILIIGILLIISLTAEKLSAVRHRRCLKHVIHVNGTRGKSAVTRLIAAGISAGGYKTFCKTTGTLPMTIDPEGHEVLIRRRGPANISEQVNILKQAVRSGAEVLVIECMAVDPELQFVAEHKILRSDIGVITNVRIDHVAEMGSQIPQVCRALMNTVPEKGKLFTADTACFPMMEAKAKTLGTEAFLAEAAEAPTEEQPFPENIALALAVCKALGVSEETALAGMQKVKADPYAAASYPLPGGALFIDGMSANDPVSTKTVLERFTRGKLISKKIFVLNCRPDRGYRTNLMIDYIEEEKPDAVWLMGRGCVAAKRRLSRSLQDVTVYPSAEALPLDAQEEGTVIYAIGNIANDGIRLMERVEKGGNDHVR